jgi:hypothetical protein
MFAHVTAVTPSDKDIVIRHNVHVTALDAESSVRTIPLLQ